MPTIQTPPGQPRTSGGLVLRAPGVLAVHAEQNLDGQHAYRPVEKSAAEGADPVDAAVDALGPVTDRRADETPH
jgi:hypothetical protein